MHTNANVTWAAMPAACINSGRHAARGAPGLIMRSMMAAVSSPKPFFVGSKTAPSALLFMRSE